MKREDVMNLPGDKNPVLCADGKFGMLLIYPTVSDFCGVQVHGEDEHRWISAHDLTATTGGALWEMGAPNRRVTTVDSVQLLLSMDWEARGGSYLC